MRHNHLLIISLLTLCTASVVLGGCKKKHEELDLSSVYTTAASGAETMAAETTTAATEASTVAPSAESKPDALGSDGNKTSYTTTSETYSKDKTTITYPIISGMSDKTKQDKINALIKKNALAITESDVYNPDTQTVDMKYSIVSLDRKRISITYTGVISSKDSYPINEFYSNTIDLNTVSDLGLNDFTDSYTMAGYILSDDVTLAGASAEVTKAFMDQRSTYDLETYNGILSDADFPLSTDTAGKVTGWPSSFSYEKDGDIYFTVPVIHALGDYVTIKYSPITK